jgi:hypothetical protein
MQPQPISVDNGASRDAVTHSDIRSTIKGLGTFYEVEKAYPSFPVALYRASSCLPDRLLPRERGKQCYFHGAVFNEKNISFGQYFSNKDSENFVFIGIVKTEEIGVENIFRFYSVSKWFFNEIPIDSINVMDHVVEMAITSIDDTRDDSFVAMFGDKEKAYICTGIFYYQQLSFLS